MTKLQKLIVRRGDLVRRYAEAISRHRRKAASIVGAELTIITREIIRMELRDEKRRAA